MRYKGTPNNDYLLKNTPSLNERIYSVLHVFGQTETYIYGFGGEVLKILPPYHANRHVVSCLYLDTWTFGLVDNKQC